MAAIRCRSTSLRAGDVAGLFDRFAKLREKAGKRTAQTFPIVVIQEAGLDGFWIHRVLVREGVESHVVDSASRPRRGIGAGRRRIA